jgi:hypothetical protein
VEAVNNSNATIHAHAWRIQPGHIAVLDDGLISIDGRMHLRCGEGFSNTQHLHAAAEVGREITRQALARQQELLESGSVS